MLLKAYGNFRFLIFSRKLDRVARDKFTEVGCINCPLYIQIEKHVLHGQVNIFLVLTHCAIVFNEMFLQRPSTFSRLLNSQ